MLYEVIDYMKLRIRESSGSGNTYFKNVDICDLPSILKKGILSMNASGNDNWASGKRANNSRDVVYLFRPTGYENSFVQYGAALLEVEVDGVENELLDGDINKGKYKEYICDTVPPENIIAVYIPKIFKDRMSFRHPKIKFVYMEAKIFSGDLYKSNLEKYGKRGFLGLIDFDPSFNQELNYEQCDDYMLDIFAQTTNFEDSSMNRYFRGILPDRKVFDLEYIHYDI